jgi:hypothetical protein
MFSTADQENLRESLCGEDFVYAAELRGVKFLKFKTKVGFLRA